MNILITGAAGYIGSVITAELVRRNHTVIALDNLVRGHRDAVSPEAIFVEADLARVEELNEIFSHHQIEAVMHLAAESLIQYSMTDPVRYFYSNVVCGMNLLDAMLNHGVSRFIFSSTAAVYGEPQSVPIEENDPTIPVNAYGESKLMFEKILHWYGHAYGLKFITLRYFNAAGAIQYFGEDHDPETHLIPNVIKVALLQKDSIPIYGVDYDTRDGSCIRDYIHVSDIAQAHILALDYLMEKQVSNIFNLGNGAGYSVLEVVEAVERVTGISIPTVVQPGRQGDPAVLVASSQLARKELGWVPEYTGLETIIESAYRWQRNNPRGYGKEATQLALKRSVL